MTVDIRGNRVSHICVEVGLILNGEQSLFLCLRQLVQLQFGKVFFLALVLVTLSVESESGVSGAHVGRDEHHLVGEVSDTSFF